MNRLILTAGLCLIITSLASSYKLMCYYTNWSKNRAGDGKFTLSDIDPDKCTHLIYAFSAISDANKLIPTAGDLDYYKSFNQLKDRNTNLKTLLSVGGWTAGTTKFSNMVSTATSRNTFIKSSIDLMRNYGFDGINLDWEFPGRGWNSQKDKKGFTLLCKELREAYEAEGTATDRPRLLVTAAVAADKGTIDAGYEVAEISKHLDFINVMTYDLRGTWDWVTGHHSALYKSSKDTGRYIYLNTDYAMQYWLKQGAPAEKLTLGFASYGRTFTLSSQSNEIHAPISGPGVEGIYTKERGFWSYYEVCLNLEGKTTHWLEDQKVPYGYSGNQWVGFDNGKSIEAKVGYVKDNNFGGVAVWSLDLDDFRGKFCKQGKYPLISHLHSLLASGKPIPTITATTTTTAAPTAIAAATNAATNTATTTVATEAPATATTTTTTTTSPMKVDPNFCYGKTPGLHSNPNDKNAYYSCVHNITYHMKCGAGLVFQETCQCCTWP